MGIELQIAENLSIPVIVAFKRRAESRINSVEYENPDHKRHMLQIGEG